MGDPGERKAIELPEEPGEERDSKVTAVVDAPSNDARHSAAHASTTSASSEDSRAQDSDSGSDFDTMVIPTSATAGIGGRHVALELEGKSLGRFEVVRSIGRGGMGFVYEVFDGERELRLALKRLSQVDARHILRFKREFRALRDLRHPNLVALDELFEHDGHWCFSMELVPGSDFLSYVRGVDPPEDVEDVTPTRVVDASSTGSSGSTPTGTSGSSEDARSVADAPRVHVSGLRRALAQLTMGLQHLHRAGKVHRDVKPSNILVTAKGRVVLLSAASISASSLGRRDEANRLVAATRDAASRSDHPLASFYASIALYAKNFMIDNDWKASKLGSREALDVWRAAGRGRGWEFDVLQQFHLWSLLMLGEYVQVQRMVPELVRGAQRTGNRFLEVSLRTFFPILWVFTDQPEEARRDLDDALGLWIPAERSFGNQQHWAIRSFTQIALYQRQVERDTERIERSWERVVNSLVGRVAVMKLETAAVYGDWLLARAEHAWRRGERSEMHRFVRGAQECIRKLRKSSLPGARPAELKLGATVAGFLGTKKKPFGSCAR